MSPGFAIIQICYVRVLMRVRRLLLLLLFSERNEYLCSFVLQLDITSYAVSVDCENIIVRFSPWNGITKLLKLPCVCVRVHLRVYVHMLCVFVCDCVRTRVCMRASTHVRVGFVIQVWQVFLRTLLWFYVVTAVFAVMPETFIVNVAVVAVFDVIVVGYAVVVVMFPSLANCYRDHRQYDEMVWKWSKYEYAWTTTDVKDITWHRYLAVEYAWASSQLINGVI